MTQEPAEKLRQSALQTASAILTLQRKSEEEIRGLNRALQQRTEELEAANHELRRQTELAREHARHADVFRTAFESSGSGMLLVGPDLRISRVNAAFCEFLGRSGEALCTMTLEDITAAADLEATRRGIGRLLRGELAVLHLEKQYLHSSGRVVWGSVAATVMRDAEGAPLHLVAQVQDIDRRKRAEAELRQLEAQLLQAQKMEALGTLAGGVAHDFNNILATILLNAEFLRDLVGRDPTAAECTSEIASAASRGAELVRQILTFSRHSERNLKPLRLEAVMNESLRILRAALPASIEIRSESIESGPVCLADATQLQQVLTNLATNAWHAMEPCGGTLTVSLAYVDVDPEVARAVPNLREGLHARIRVSDTGAGMDPETLGRIFEPFFTTKDTGKGTGLGLSVVHGIVHGHGGAIGVRSARGRGTMFEVFLPTVPERTLPLAPATDGPLRGTGGRILVVDDEPGLARALSRLLCTLDYEARATSSPEEALAIFQAGRFDLALVDFNMPTQNGVELARRLRALSPDLPVLMMSGYSAPVAPTELARAGIIELLAKPVSQAMLAEKVDRALHHRDPR